MRLGKLFGVLGGSQKPAMRPRELSRRRSKTRPALSTTSSVFARIHWRHTAEFYGQDGALRLASGRDRSPPQSGWRGSTRRRPTP